jgi:hypothetical protein
MKSLRRFPQRVAVPVLAALGVASFVAYESRSTRLTMTNAGILVDYAPAGAALIFACAVSMAVVGGLARARATRLVGLALALVAAFVGLDCVVFGIAAGRDALSVRSLTVRTTLPWTRIAKLENELAAVVVTDLAGQRVRLDLDSLTAQQRSAFDRTLARRIWESGPPRGAD